MRSKSSETAPVADERSAAQSVNISMCYTHFCDHVHMLVCDFTMDRKLELRAILKFCVSLRKLATKALDMLQQAYANEAIRWVRYFEWHLRL